jgi:sialate O-acetylesterase
MKKPSLFLAGTILVAAILILASNVSAEPTLDPMFSHHMVLQREMPVPIWGTADPGQKVMVSFRDQKKETTADGEGKWSVTLDPLKVGKPGKLTIAGKKTPLVLDDVLVGDVWLGSGQSNMERSVRRFARGDEVLAAMAKDGPYPNLRLYRGDWKIAATDDIGGFSAIMFSFGLPLQRELGVPVGLIVGAVTRTASGRWLSPEMALADPGVTTLLESSEAGKTLLKEVKAYPKALAKWERAAQRAEADGKPLPEKPQPPSQIGDLYARFIEPVVPYAIRGVLWDQGEHGVGVRGVDQFTMTGALIAGWRKAWAQGDFPFLYVQKPSGGGCAWDYKNPLNRMADSFSELPEDADLKADGGFREVGISLMNHANTAMVIASDLGGNIHPTDKSSYGKRACQVALSVAYDREGEIYGPLYDSHAIEGDKIRIRYTHVGKGLAFRHGDRLQGFEIAGEDRLYHWADARIDGDTVVVSCKKTPKPLYVRYGYANNRTWANLFNKDGLPALTFRADQ